MSFKVTPIVCRNCMEQLSWVVLTLMVSLITNPHCLEAFMKALKGLLKKELGFFYQSLFQLKEYLAVPSKAMSLPSDKFRYMFFNYVELGEFPQVQP